MLAGLQNDSNVIFGLGASLLEEVAFDQGRVINPNLSDYMIPSFQDIPADLKNKTLEKEGSNFHGIGEMTLPPVAPAIAKAIENAVGVRIRDLPITPEKSCERSAKRKTLIMNKSPITLRKNGKQHRLSVSNSQTLLQVLRDTLYLDSVRDSCGIGMCGTCTVLVDGQAMSSCLMLAALVDGKKIITVEGLGNREKLHPVQQAFIDHGAFQCVYCPPGFVLSTVALLNEVSDADDGTIREYLSGNLCRSGSYVNILNAEQASKP